MSWDGVVYEAKADMYAAGLFAVSAAKGIMIFVKNKKLEKAIAYQSWDKNTVSHPHNFVDVCELVKEFVVHFSVFRIWFENIRKLN